MTTLTGRKYCENIRLRPLHPRQVPFEGNLSGMRYTIRALCQFEIVEGMKRVRVAQVSDPLDSLRDTAASELHPQSEAMRSKDAKESNFRTLEFSVAAAGLFRIVWTNYFTVTLTAAEVEPLS
jgi:hypothetical protein